MGFSLARFIFFGKEWQTKIRLDPENFKGSIEIDNRSFSVFFCQNLVCSLLSFSPWPFGTCPVLLHMLFSFPPFGCSGLWPHFCHVTKYESSVTSPLPTQGFFSLSPSLIMYLTHASVFGDLQAVFPGGSLFVPFWDETWFADHKGLAYPRNWWWGRGFFRQHFHEFCCGAWEKHI